MARLHRMTSMPARGDVCLIHHGREGHGACFPALQAPMGVSFPNSQKEWHISLFMRIGTSVAYHHLLPCATHASHEQHACGGNAGTVWEESATGTGTHGEQGPWCARSLLCQALVCAWQGKSCRTSGKGGGLQVGGAVCFRMLTCWCVRRLVLLQQRCCGAKAPHCFQVKQSGPTSCAHCPNRGLKLMVPTCPKGD